MKNNNQQDYDKYMSHRLLGEKQVPAMVQFLINIKVVKDVKTGFYVYFYGVIILIIASILIAYFTFFNGPENIVSYDELTPAQKNALPYQERIYLENRNNQ
jgi:hypothetical protein